MRRSASLALLVATGVAVGAVACSSSNTPGTSSGGSSSSSGTPASSGSPASSGAGTNASSSGTTSSTGGGTSTGGSTSVSSTSGTATTTSTSGASSSGGTLVTPMGGSDAGCTASQTAPTPNGAFPFPPVVTYGDPVIHAPKIVSVLFEGDTTAPQVAAFGNGLTGTCYWDAIRGGYCDQNSTTSCVGDGPTGETVLLSMSAGASYTDPSMGTGTLQPFLASLITAGTVPAPDANTIYQLYFPASTSINMDGSLSCDAFDGYHGSMTMGSQTVFYSVIPECAAPQMTPAITTFQNTTITASHEAIETATDGDVSGNGGYYLDVENTESTWGWDDIFGGEVADLCVDEFLLGLDETSENGFTAQRIWSLPNATAGKNPCVPIPTGEVYFNTYPDVTTLVQDVGTTQTITVHALADGTMPAWTVLPEDWTDPSGQKSFVTLSFGPDGGQSSAQVQSGDTVSLSVTLTADPSNDSAAPYGEADVVLVSANSATASDVTAAHIWPFVVITTAQAKSWGATQMKGVRHRPMKRRTPRRHVRRTILGGVR